VYPLNLLVEFGLGTLMTRDLAAQPETTPDYLRVVVSTRLLLGGVVMLALLAAAPLISADPLVVAGLHVSAPMVIILPLFSTFTAVFRARQAMLPVMWLNLGMLAAQVALTALILAAGGGVVAALIVNTATSTGQLAAAWVWYRVRFSFHKDAWLMPPDVKTSGYQTAKSTKGTEKPTSSAFSPFSGLVISAAGRFNVWRHKLEHNPEKPAIERSQRARVAALLGRAAPFALAGVFVALQGRLTVILLESYTATAEVGYFAAANRFVEAARLLPNAFFGALFPALSDF
jgi:O-antigen/teichoic acid export membrane protein